MKGSYLVFTVAAAFALAGCGQLDAAAPPPATTARAPDRAAAVQRSTYESKVRANQGEAENQGRLVLRPGVSRFWRHDRVSGRRRSVGLVLRSSTKNIYDEPPLGSGAPIFYLNLHFLAGTHFRIEFKVEGGLTGAKIQAGETYTAFGIVAVGHLVLMFPPCYAVATQGPYGGILPGLGELFQRYHHYRRRLRRHRDLSRHASQPRVLRTSHR